MTWLTEADVARCRAHGVAPAVVEAALDRLAAGPAHVRVDRPCTLGDGIGSLTDEDGAAASHARGRVEAFVPASGAATRLFRDPLPDDPRLPFRDADRWRGTPKALIPFHRYPSGVRTALDEQLVEAAALGCARVHVTVAPAHRGAFVVPDHVRLSVQSPATDMPALGADGPVRRDGRLVLRPGGHGALLANVADTGADLLVVKNVDNIVADPHRPTILSWRRRLIGRAVRLQRAAFDLLGRADGEGARSFARAHLGVDLPPAAALERLDRPLRVCAMVENRGEPGGGPFWVDGRPQIVEASQIDVDDPAQQRVLSAATHFNPVDLVLGLRDHAGRPFDLAAFTDPSAVIVTRRVVAGQDARVIEHPGLWNGAMAGWNTVFVEVPAACFQPVKVAADLLRPAHQV